HLFQHPRDGRAPRRAAHSEAGRRKGGTVRLIPSRLWRSKRSCWAGWVDMCARAIARAVCVSVLSPREAALQRICVEGAGRSSGCGLQRAPGASSATQGILARVARQVGRYSRGRITMTELTAAKGSVIAEAGPLAGEMARVVGEMVATLEQHLRVLQDEAKLENLYPATKTELTGMGGKDLIPPTPEPPLTHPHPQPALTAILASPAV